jgi:uncharacterized protein YodC (DUF2158 family)
MLRYYPRNAEMSFGIGDTVKLASGGPVMTVIEIKGDMAVCQWFSGNAARTAQVDSFHVNALRPFSRGGPAFLRIA